MKKIVSLPFRAVFILAGNPDSIKNDDMDVSHNPCISWKEDQENGLGTQFKEKRKFGGIFFK
jgi:hypothetical protein